MQWGIAGLALRPPDQEVINVNTLADYFTQMTHLPMLLGTGVLPDCFADSDPTLLVGWSGWHHLQQATALIHYYDVENRVKQGGHNVPAEDVRRRYGTGVRNLFRLYRPILDGRWLYDASRLPPKLVAKEEQGRLTIKQKRLYKRIEQEAEEGHEETD